MLAFAEIIDPQLTDSARRDVEALPDVGFKVRHPGLVSVILDIHPGAQILARNPGEGYDVGDVANGYAQWLPTLGRYRQNIMAYELGNELNAKVIDPEWWMRAVNDWLHWLAAPPVPLCTPGLIPNVRIAEWRSALNLVNVQYRAVHCYWQQDGPEAAVQAALHQTSVPPSRIICTEFNSAGASAAYQPTPDQRANECRRAMQGFAQAGIRAACLFSLTPWSGGDWSYAYDLPTTASILAAGRTTPKRTRRPKPAPTPVMEAPVMEYPTGVDVSNYTGELSVASLDCWKQQGVQLVIAQAVTPPAGYPVTVTRQQLQACADAGITAHAYIYLWDYDEALARFKRELALLDGLSVPMVWVDVEDVEGSGYAPAYRVEHLHQAVAVVQAAGYAVGIYTANWYWHDRMGGSTAFSDLPLWNAEYDGVPDPDVFHPFGGWESCAIKQFAGDTELCGVHGIDLNAVRPELLAASEPPAEPEPDALAHLDAAFGAFEQMKVSRLTVARRRELASYGQDELVIVKQLTGIGT